MKINLNDYEILDIDEIKYETKETVMYDIEVENDNTFFISKNKKDNILVHNCDGNHIRGLLVNFINVFWPELLHTDMIYDFTTPIIKCTKGTKVKYYYRLDDYKKEKINLIGWNLKWIKGLGTIEPFEMKGFFKNIKKHLIRYHYDKIETDDLIDMAFNSKRTGDRKEWMKNYVPINFIDKFTTKQTYDKFINNELMEFSMMDNIRTIPSVVDGMKPGQRKVIYTLYKKGIKNEIKVSSLSGAIIEVSSYHQGNISIEKTIINMAQDFVGTNNINLLIPNGQFGSRLKGGDDSASPRYIFTKLNDLTNYIFLKDDDPVLDYQDDDGYLIEPNYYVPIIPLILINGAAGIGYGYSTEIPSFNPLDIITYLQNKIKNKKNIQLTPYYKGFKGDIILDVENKRYLSRGIINKINDITYEIKELPLWSWNDKYYEFLDDLSSDKKDQYGKLIRKSLIKNWNKNSDDKEISIKIFFNKDAPIEFLNDIYKNLKLESYISFSNMHLFDQNKKIKKYNDQYEIIDDFMKIRLEYYTKRKNYLLEEFKRDIRIIQNRMKFLKLVIDGDIVVYKKTKDVVEASIEKCKLEKVDDSYGYLLNMSIMSFTMDKIHDLKDEYDKMKEKMKKLEQTPETSIWLSELQELKTKIKF